MKKNEWLQAILEGDATSVERLRDSLSQNEKDAHGFSPVELARLLGKQDIEKLLVIKKPLTLKVLLKGEEAVKLMGVKEFEEFFSIHYRPFLTFDSYDDLEEAISYCPLLFKYQWIFGKKDEFESYYQELMLHGYLEPSLLKWIDEKKGYGVFSEANLGKGAFIGEYTGLFKPITETNPYCFQYPHRLFSRRYFMIDAEKEGNLLRFINHSETPNLEPLWLYDRGLLHLVLITKRPIKKGEELSFDYGANFWRNKNSRII